MHWPQITVIVLLAISGTINLFSHGKPKGDYNFWAWLISFAIWMILLINGGFFSQGN